VGDGRVGREVLDHELAQLLRVGGGDPEEVVDLAGHVEDREHARQLAHGVGEVVDLLARVDRQADGDHGLQGPAQRGEVDLGVEAEQDPAGAQGADALQARRRRDADARGETRVGHPRVARERLEDRAVGAVQRFVRHGRHRGTSGRTNGADSAVCRTMFGAVVGEPNGWHTAPMDQATRTAAPAAIRDSILDTIGGTPLVRLSRLGAGLTPQLVAKVEMLNPGGSIKDRVAVSLIEAAERAGDLRPGGTIVEPTSGNTGTGLAIAARLKGYNVIAVMPDKISKDKIDLLRAYGAEVVVTPTAVAPEDPQSYYEVAKRLVREIPGAFQPNQYANPANPAAHYASTGPELWEQTEGRITHLVAGVGTGGTITGIGRYLRERKPGLEIVGADPYGSIYSSPEVKPYLVEGVGEDFWPTTFDPAIVDRYITVSDREAFAMTRRLAAVEGILTGGSGGMAVHAAVEVARGIDDPEALLVVVLPDSGRGYLSKVFNDAWMEQHGFLERAGGMSVGDVLRSKHEHDEVPPLVAVKPTDRVRDAIARLHEHGLSQLPVVDGGAVVGALGERGLLKHAAGDAGLLDAEVARVMEPPFPTVAAADDVREAIDLLTGDVQALLVADEGRPAGIVTRADLLEALAL
jgi:cystathionine beta-synthase